MISTSDAKKIIQTEYGKNLRTLLVVDEEEGVDRFIEIFKTLFRDLNIFDDYGSVVKYFNVKSRYDLIVVHINKEANKAKDMIRSMRNVQENLNIIVFSTQAEQFYKESLQCACADGILPYPLDEDYTYRYLYRFLKKIVDVKDMKSYITVLENIINPVELTQPLVDKKIQQDKQSDTSRKISDNKRKNIRFNKPHKVSAVNFIEELDSTLIDKIEVFQEDLDRYMVVVYDIENVDENSVNQMMQEIVSILSDFYHLVDSMVFFPIITDTFANLTSFLKILTLEQLKDSSKKSFLVEVLIGLGKDLEVWIDEIFIQQRANDIHYFDASFANNCMEIESLFSKESLDIGDEDDLEFFN